MLPTIDLPLFDVVIPTLNKRIKMRPMRGKEEKILLMAKESKSETDILEAVKQVVDACFVDQTIKCDKLAIVDIEYLFIKLRSASVSDFAEFFVVDGDDSKEYKFRVDLKEIKVVGIPEDKKPFSIQINDDFMLTMKYPTGRIYSEMLFDNKTFTEYMDIFIKECIDKVYKGDQVFTFDDVPAEALTAWLDNLDIATLDKMRDFILELPHLEYEITYKNTLGQEKKILLSRLTDFFTLR